MTLNRLMRFSILYFLLMVVAYVLLPLQTRAQSETYLETLEGKVIAIADEGQETFMDELVPFQVLEIELSRGEREGEVIEVKNSAAGLGMVAINYQSYQVGDHLKIVISADSEGNKQYMIDGYVKRNGLIALGVLFVLVVIAVGRGWGILSLVGLVTSFVVIFKLIIPLIISGIDPVLAAVLGSVVIVPTTFYISHGFNIKTHVGVVATFIGLMVTGILATHFVAATHLTGFASEEAGFLQVERSGSIDIVGILIAGIIIGTLGVLDDVTVGQSSTVQQLHKANPKMKMQELFVNGMKVGQDHISSMVNTLVLVYAGSALPLLLLFFGSQHGVFEIMEFELISEEIVRMLVGSIGLVLAAPLATIMAAYLFSRNNQENSTSHQAHPTPKRKRKKPNHQQFNSIS